MKWQFNIVDNPEEVCEFLSTLGNGPDFETKILYLEVSRKYIIFYPIKRNTYPIRNQSGPTK
jgi:hypothetical protein